MRHLFLAVLLALSVSAHGFYLDWDASPDPRVTSYNVYECTQSGCDVGINSVVVGNTAALCFDIGTPVAAFYFVTGVGLVKGLQAESVKSNSALFDPATPPTEVSACAPAVPLVVPTNVRATK